jgi:hypothetical protein
LIKLLVIVVYHKVLGPTSDPSSLGLVQGELPSNETIEVWSVPVGFEIGW